MPTEDGGGAWPAGEQLLRFGSFSDAVDEYFSKLEAQRAAQALAAQQGAALKKVRLG